MDKAQLLGTLNELVGRYETHRGFINRARAQQATGKFAEQVIDKVVTDHSAKASSVASQVAPLVPQMESLLASLRKEREGVVVTKVGLDEEMQEFELRLAIGELSDPEFENGAGALRERIGSASARIAAIDVDLGELGGALDRWRAVAAEGDAKPAKADTKMEAAKAELPKSEPVKAEAAPKEAAKPEPVKSEPETARTKSESRRKGKDVEADARGGLDVEIPEPVGPHITRTEIKEDISAVFTGVAPVGVAAEEDIAIETADIPEDAADGPSSEVRFAFTSEPLVDEVAADGPRPADEKKDQDRRALLLYQEGTTDEQIYPFTNDNLTIGRGRENDIQIKNDSKVSRYHCKLFRRGNNFYIEDVKSSNGTLVNGDLITDRRLFGGEEIIIGETFFRFRIMD